MSGRREGLNKLTDELVDAFNRMDLDALEFQGEELVAKRAYMKLATPHLEPEEGA